MVDYAKASWIPSPNFNARASRKCLEVIIHTSQNGEHRCGAEWLGGGHFKSASTKVSANYGVDCDSVVQYVLEKDIAWHASVANGYSIGIELICMAGQTDAEWADAYSIAQLDLAAHLVADICLRHDIPICKLTPEQAAAKRPGICGHVDITKGFGKGTHWDPGPNFPWPAFIEQVAHHHQAMVSLSATRPT